MKTKRNLIPIWLLCLTVFSALSGAAQPVVKVGTGLNCHSLFIKGDGSLWAMGRNNFGELGDGISTNIPSGINFPEQIVASNVTAVAAGVEHSLFIKSDGSLWAMGGNSVDDTNNPSGQLGDGTYNNTNRPEMIVASNVTAVAAGGYHSLFLKSDGSLWGMGYNNSGQLGDGTYNNTNRPEMIVASNVTVIAAGLYHSLFLKSDGSLWGMGYNYFGQLGDGTYGAAPYYATNLPEEIVASNVVAVAAGQAFSFFIKSDGSLWAMGEDMYGELGDGTNRPLESGMNLPEQIVTSNVTAVACGLWHTLFVERDGSLWAMGYGGGGELGNGYFGGTSLPVRVIARGVIAVAAGFEDSFLIKNDGSLWGMGRNLLGELGDGTYNSTNLPELIVAGPPGYNQISFQLLSGGSVGLSYVGMAGTKYELDRSFSLSPANWVPQVTNTASSSGMLLFTNTPDTTANNFWRIRSVP